MRTIKETMEAVDSVSIAICAHGRRVGDAGSSCDCGSGRMYVLSTDAHSLIEADRRELMEKVADIQKACSEDADFGARNGHPVQMRGYAMCEVLLRLLDGTYKPNTP